VRARRQSVLTSLKRGGRIQANITPPPGMEHGTETPVMNLLPKFLFFCLCGQTEERELRPAQAKQQRSRPTVIDKKTKANSALQNTVHSKQHTKCNNPRRHNHSNRHHKPKPLYQSSSKKTLLAHRAASLRRGTVGLDRAAVTLTTTRVGFAEIISCIA